MKRYYDRNEIDKNLKKNGIDKYVDSDLKEKMMIYEYEPGEFIYMSGDNQGIFYFFLEGILKVTLFSDNGEDMLLGLVRPFEIIGDAEIILKEETLYFNIEVKKRAKLIGIRSSEIEEYLGRRKDFYKILAESLGRKMRQTGKRQSRMLLYSLEKRFQFFIDEIRDDQEVLENLTKEEIAGLMGVSQRHMRRVYLEFEKKGIIIRGKKGIELI